jgi:hypothetical protein
MRKAAHRVSLEAGDTLRQGGALGDGEVVNLLVGTIHILVANCALQLVAMYDPRDVTQLQMSSHYRCVQ